MRRFGHGVREWVDGDRYDGQIIYGVLHGHGVYEFGDGRRYEGQFKDYKWHGHGVYEFGDGERYEGQWKDGEEHGDGVYESEDGTRYEGHWDDGKPQGRFFEWRADGPSTTTLLEGGQLISTEPIPFLSMDEMRLGVLWAKGEMKRAWR